MTRWVWKRECEGLLRAWTNGPELGRERWINGEEKAREKYSDIYVCNRANESIEFLK